MNIMTWLMENGMTAAALAREIGVSRMTIWKVSKGKPVDAFTAKAITVWTNGKVRPKSVHIGRPRKVVNKNNS